MCEHLNLIGFSQIHRSTYSTYLRIHSINTKNVKYRDGNERIVSVLSKLQCFRSSDKVIKTQCNVSYSIEYDNGAGETYPWITLRASRNEGDNVRMHRQCCVQVKQQSINDTCSLGWITVTQFRAVDKKEGNLTYLLLHYRFTFDNISCFSSKGLRNWFLPQETALYCRTLAVFTPPISRIKLQRSMQYFIA